MPPADPNADLLPHEIAGPVWYLPYPLPVMIGLGVLALLLVDPRRLGLRRVAPRCQPASP